MTTTVIQITENQWQCECTLVNEIYWDSYRRTRCLACDLPNDLIDELIKEKRYALKEEQL